MVRWSDLEFERYMRHGPAGLLSEKAWQDAVLQVARRTGFLCYHTYDSRRSPSGFPDLCCVKPGAPLFVAELKTDSGSVSQAQQAWLEALEGCTGVVSGIWRPKDAQAIFALLRGG